MQVAIGMGFISVAQGMINIIRALLVNSTHGSPRPNDQPGEPDPELSASFSSQTPLKLRDEGTGSEWRKDNPRLRFRY